MPAPRAVVINGIRYPSLNSAAKQLGVRQNTLFRRVQRQCKEPTKDQKHVYTMGCYSQTEFCRQTGQNMDVLRKQLKRHMELYGVSRPEAERIYFFNAVKYCLGTFKKKYGKLKVVGKGYFHTKRFYTQSGELIAEYCVNKFRANNRLFLIASNDLYFICMKLRFDLSECDMQTVNQKFIKKI